MDKIDKAVLYNEEFVSPDQASLTQDSTNPPSDALCSNELPSSSHSTEKTSAASTSLSGYSRSRRSVESNSSAVVVESEAGDVEPVVSSLPCLGMQQTNLSPPTSMLEMVQSSPNLHDNISTNSGLDDPNCMSKGGSQFSEGQSMSLKNIGPGQTYMYGIRHAKSLEHLEEYVKDDPLSLRNAKSAHFDMVEKTRNRFKGVQHKVHLHGSDNDSHGKTESTA